MLLFRAETSSLNFIHNLQAVAESRKRNGGKKDNLAQSTSQAKPKPMQEAAPAVEAPVADAELLEETDRPASDMAGAETGPSTSGQPEAEHAEAPAHGQDRKQIAAQQAILDRQQPTTGKGMKDRKKEFLKRRKLKKKGGRQTEEEVLEAQLAEDPHKPKFGEQAMAPIKVIEQYQVHFLSPGHHLSTPLVTVSALL